MQEAVDLLIKGLEVLSINEGDTVVIRSAINPMTQNLLETIQNGLMGFLKARGRNDVNFLIIPPNVDVAVLSSQDMKNAGWQRVTRIEVVGGNGHP